MEKPLFNADNAEEYFSSLCVSYRETANEIFKRDNEGRHASEHMYSAEYQKYIGMQIAMREVLEYFSKFELSRPQQTKADHIRAMSDEELANLLTIGHGNFDCSVCKIGDQRKCDIECKKHCVEWLQQPVEEAQ